MADPGFIERTTILPQNPLENEEISPLRDALPGTALDLRMLCSLADPRDKGPSRSTFFFNLHAVLRQNVVK